MRTDMLSWTKLSQTVKQVDTKKKFFGKYLFKVIIYCPGGRLILNTTGKSIFDLVEDRIEFDKSIRYNYGGSWAHSSISRSRNLEFKENVNIDQLEKLKFIKTENSDIKVRIEEPHVSIYCNDESELYTVVSQIRPDRLLEIHKPRSVMAQEALDRGEIIIKKELGFNFKIHFKEHVFKDITVKHQIHDYLYALEDDIQLTKNTKKQLGNNQLYFPGGYFYSKDTEIITFISLICPYLISGIYKVTKVDS